MEMATGMACISTSVDVSVLGRPRVIVVRKAMSGRNTILNILNPKAIARFVYFLP